MVTSNHGLCVLCKQDVQYRSMTKHLNKCLAQEISPNITSKEKIFLIKIYSGKLFWLFIEINGLSTLEKLDAFLRRTWLECCGHMSQFNINGEYYSSEEEMGVLINSILNIGTEFDYVYDFGSSTELKGKVVSIRPGKLSKKLRLLAQNTLPEEVKCTTCQELPEVICSVCYDFCCKKCKQKHNSCEGEEFMLPIVNSPRMGICGYTGQD